MSTALPSITSVAPCRYLYCVDGIVHMTSSRPGPTIPCPQCGGLGTVALSLDLPWDATVHDLSRQADGTYLSCSDYEEGVGGIVHTVDRTARIITTGGRPRRTHAAGSSAWAVCGMPTRGDDWEFAPGLGGVTCLACARRLAAAHDPCVLEVFGGRPIQVVWFEVYDNEAEAEGALQGLRDKGIRPLYRTYPVRTGPDVPTDKFVETLSWVFGTDLFGRPLPADGSEAADDL